MAKSYYLISDLHIGGDEALGVCDYEAELVAFLQKLAGREEEAELVIVGDIFGMWEFTNIKGPEKLQALMQQFPNIFEAFREAGEKIKITLLPGNHDYEIACYPEFVGILKDFNIDLEQRPAITRELAGKRFWIEHGNQYDDFNHMPDFGNPYAQPVGYFITSGMVSGAGKHSQYGRYNWLKDIQSVYPTEQIPYLGDLELLLPGNERLAALADFALFAAVRVDDLRPGRGGPGVAGYHPDQYFPLQRPVCLLGLPWELGADRAHHQCHRLRDPGRPFRAAELHPARH